MKAIKYLMIGAMLTLSQTVTVAQTEYEPQANAIYKVLKENPNNPNAAKDKVKAYEKAYKKNPAAMVSLGNAFLGAGLLDKAVYYADMALKKNKNFGDAFVLKGDVEQMKDDGGQAAMWYQNAMSVDPKNPNGYLRYANVYRKDINTFDQTMQQLKQQIPSFPVEAESGHSFFTIGNATQAYKYYSQANASSMDEKYFYEYMLSAFFCNKREEALDLAKQGASKYANTAYKDYFARYAMTCAADLGKMDDAAKYAEMLSNSELELSANDLQYIGQVMCSQGKYQEAIDKLNEALKKDEKAYRCYQYLSEAYNGLGDEDKALSYSEKYISLDNNARPSDFAKLANIYGQKAEDGIDVDANLEKGMGVYNIMAEKFPELAGYAHLQQGNMAFKLSKNEIAMNKWQVVIDELWDKSNRTEQQNGNLIQALRLLGAHLWGEKGLDVAAPYMEKLVQLAPNDEYAVRYLETKK